MIINSVKTKLFEIEAKHVVIPINIEGFRDSQTTFKAVEIWPELFHTGDHEMGDVISKITGGKTYHAIVCHSTFHGWGENQCDIIKSCFDKIETDEPIASELIGSGIFATMQGADTGQILLGMCESKKNIILHSDLTMPEIDEYYKKAKRKLKTYGNLL